MKHVAHWYHHLRLKDRFPLYHGSANFPRWSSTCARKATLGKVAKTQSVVSQHYRKLKTLGPQPWNNYQLDSDLMVTYYTMSCLLVAVFLVCSAVG